MLLIAKPNLLPSLEMYHASRFGTLRLRFYLESNLMTKVQNCGL